MIRKNPRAQPCQMPVLLVVGKREAKEGNVSLRCLSREGRKTLSLRESLIRLKTEALRSTNAPVRLPQSDRAADETERIVQGAAR